MRYINGDELVHHKHGVAIRELSSGVGLTSLADENNPGRRVFYYLGIATGFRSGICSAAVAPNSSDADYSSGIRSARGPSGLPAWSQRSADAEVSGARSARLAPGDTPDGTPGMIHLHIPYAENAMQDY